MSAHAVPGIHTQPTRCHEIQFNGCLHDVGIKCLSLLVGVIYSGIDVVVGVLVV